MARVKIIATYEYELPNGYPTNDGVITDPMAMMEIDKKYGEDIFDTVPMISQEWILIL